VSVQEKNRSAQRRFRQRQKEKVRWLFFLLGGGACWGLRRSRPPCGVCGGAGPPGARQHCAGTRCARRCWQPTPGCAHTHSQYTTHTRTPHPPDDGAGGAGARPVVGAGRCWA
jgi:hypothetical protein